MPAGRRELVRMLVLVAATGVLLSVWSTSPRIDGAVVLHGLLQAVLVMVIAAPIAGMVHWLGGGDERATVRAARFWGLVCIVVLLLIQLAGFTLLSRFAAPPAPL